MFKLRVPAVAAFTGAVLGAGMILSACSSQDAVSSQTSAGGIMVGKNVQVSTAHATVPHVEVIIGADPLNAKNLIACSILKWRSANQITDSTTAAYVSRDGGATWRLSASDPIGSWDPDCLYDALGRAYFISGTGETHHQATLQRWDPQGRSLAPFTLSGFADRPWVTVATGNALYVTYTPDSRTTMQEVRVSHDGGAHFSNPFGRFPSLSPGPTIFTNIHPVVLSDGTYLQPIQTVTYDWTENVTSDLVADPKRIISNHDGIMRVVRIAPGARMAQVIHAFDTYGDGGTIPSTAVDAASKFFKDRVYLTWADQRSGRLQILVTYSVDKGRTWSTPSVVDDEPFSGNFIDGPDDVNPTMAVNRNGVIGIVWQDRRDNPDDLGYYVRFSASLDGGDTWLPSVRVSEAPNTVRHYDETTIPWITPSSKRGTIDIRFTDDPWLTQGHTAGLAADRNGVFHALWVDNRTGVPQMWTAPITVSGTVTRYGDVSLDAFRDVSDSVVITPWDCGYDRASGHLWVELQLKNTSKRTLRDVKLRILSLRSPLGVPSIPQPTYNLAGGSLVPGAKSPPQRLEVDLSHMQAEHEGGFSIYTLADMNVRVLAR